MEEYISLLKKYIDSGIVAVVAVDVKYLKYFVEYQTSHSESFHYVTICGYSDDKIYFFDSFRCFIEGEIHSVSYDEFNSMVQPEENVFHFKLEFIILEQLSSKSNTNIHISEEHFMKSINEMFQESVPNYQNGWIRYSGLCALIEFSKEMELISKIGDEYLIEGYIKKLFPRIILCAQQRKGNISYVKKITTYVSSSDDVFKMCKTLQQEWELLKIIFCNARKREWKTIAEIAAKSIKKIYDLEYKLLSYIKDQA